MENGIGGFTPDGREYVDRPRRRSRDAAAVVERPGQPGVRHHGQQRRARRSRWADNSRENRLTPFANDPVTDPTGEAIYPARRGLGRRVGRDARAAAAHGRLRALGDSSRRRRRRAISTPSPASSRSWRSCVAPDDPVKLSRADADEHVGSTTRRLSVFGYVEWCLGPPRDRRAPLRRDRASMPRPARFSRRNAYNTEFADRVAFFRATEPPQSFTCDRDGVHRPQPHAGRAGGALPRRSSAGRAGAGLDPCAALQIVVEIAPGESRQRRVRARPGARPRRTRVELAARYALARRRATQRSRARRGSGTTRSARCRCTRRTTRSI